MSNTVNRQQSLADAARSVPPSAPHADTPLPDFQTSSPIELEIARSERASAALAATRALARAAFTDSQLAAEAVADADIDTTDWIRTEYAALDHSVTARVPPNGPACAARGAVASGRNRVAGTFNPGIGPQHGRTFPGASIVNSQIKTRDGNQARFLQESRLTPRGASVVGTAAKIEQSLVAGAAQYAKPAMIPMLATPTAAPVARPAVPVTRRAPTGESVKFALAAGLGAAIVLAGGGVALKAGWLSHTSPTHAAPVAPQAAAARAAAATSQEIEIAPPAAGVATTRSNEEVQAALAAAARAAAVPVASVHAAGPSRVARALPPGAATVAGPQWKPSVSQQLPALSKDNLAAAIASAQSRADNFLSSSTGTGSPTAAPALKHE